MNSMLALHEGWQRHPFAGAKDTAHSPTPSTRGHAHKRIHDKNGNLIADANKGITSVLYNHLNMPTEVKFDNSNTKKINYTYDADGIKLRKVANDHGSVTATDYAGGFVYRDGDLEFMHTAEGYAEPQPDGSFSYIYQYRDHLGNVRLSYSDANGDGGVTPAEIREENSYYPFGLKMQGFNNVVSSVQFKHKTYQGQEWHDELGLNWYSFKYRNYDPAIGRFFNIDPLAQEYAYNSTYAFQENKLGMGVELEGAELLKRFKEGMSQFSDGVSNLFKNETSKELERRVESGKTNSPEVVEQNQQEAIADRSIAMGDIAEGTTETVKGGAQATGDVLENTGDAITVAGIVTAQPEIIAVGETISNTGAAINVAIDFSDGKPLEQIALERGPGVVLGQLGKTATKAMKRAGGATQTEAQTRTQEVIIKAHEKTYEVITEKTIIDTRDKKPK